MLNTNKSIELRNEIDLMVQYISKELMSEFGKSKEEAMKKIQESEVEETLVKDKLRFHESPYTWAISILTDQNDVEALEKHFYH
ncbi:hypothetical protein BME96_15945 [Virgibacillus halodenitrificans]|uniref:Uncharacterized protein n=1 Tax=Virgibacillus halodenitrificans TaxID=1482 RepID=A0AAC9J1C1_VIRHA|nr:hypothetical protein [Virgibacillus halodenitrificans]APC49591.1 hypothetical protein BME96_15945 [Virgibacillus halodenitrificans]